MIRFSCILSILVFGSLAFAETEKAATGATVQDLIKLRDPFKRPVLKLEAGESKSELESFSIDKFSLAGVLTGPRKTRAVVVGPDGKTYVVGESTRIGLRKGVITQIRADRVVVVEKITNVFGEVERVESEIRLRKAKIGQKGVNSEAAAPGAAASGLAPPEIGRPGMGE